MSINFNGYYTFVIQNPELYKELSELLDTLCYELPCFRLVNEAFHISLGELEPAIKKLERNMDAHLNEGLGGSVKRLLSILQEISDYFVDKDNVYTKIDGRVRFQFCEIILKNELTY